MRRNRSRFRAIMASPVTLILALIILFFMFKAAINIHFKSELIASKYDEAETNLVKLEKNRDQLNQSIQNLSTEYGVEAEIREKYHAVESGESVAVIVSPDENLTSTSVNKLVPSGQLNRLSWWSRLLQSLGF